MHRPAPALANACWGGRTWPLGIDWRTTMHRLPASPLAFLLVASLAGCASAPVADAPAQRYDLLVRHGVVHDGSVAAPQRVGVDVCGAPNAALLPHGNAAHAKRGSARTAERRYVNESSHQHKT